MVLMTTKNTTYTPAHIGPFNIRNKPNSLEQLRHTITNAQEKCKRELCKLLPLPDDKVTNDPIKKPFSALKRQRKYAYEQVSTLENYRNALNLLEQYVNWLCEVTYRVEKSTFDEFKAASLFHKSYDTSLLKVGIYVPRETEVETEDFLDLFIEKRIARSIIVICLAPFPKNGGYKFRNPYSISEIPNLIAFRINGVRIRINGERKPAAYKVSMKNCSTDEALLRYEKESSIWETRLYERLITLQNFKSFFEKLAEITGNSNDPWHNVPVHFVREKTFQKFVENDKFYRYCNNSHAKIGVAMVEDTSDTRYQLLQQRRKRQCFVPDEITQHDRFSDVVLLVCIPPIPKWPILNWD